MFQIDQTETRFARNFARPSQPADRAPVLPRNTILQCDCIAAMRELPPMSVDFILTDPPYLCRYQDRNGRTVRNDDNDR